MVLEERPYVGLECHLYRNTATRATPTMVLIARAMNVNVSIPKGEAAGGSRVSKWRYKKGTFKEFELTFGYEKKAGTDAVFDGLQAAALADTIDEYVVLDGLIAETGAQGPRAFCELFDVSLNQELEAEEEVEFVAKATYYEESAAEVPPIWYEVP